MKSSLDKTDNRKSVIKGWIFAAIGIVAVLVVAQLAPLTGQEGGSIARFFGRFHPLVLHFPVAFLCLAALLELSRLFPGLKHLSRFVGPVLVLTALSACVAVILGILLAANEGHAGALIERHRTRGIAVAVLSCLAAATWLSAKVYNSKALWFGYRGGLAVAILAMSLAAHDGGSLVHGPSYLADHAPKALVPLLDGHVPVHKPEAKSEDDHAVAVNGDAHHMAPVSAELQDRYSQDVGSFLNGYCSRCHGDGLQEASVRFDEFDPNLTTHASQHDWQRVLGVLGAHRMPPEDSKQPNGNQRAKAMAWIQEALEEQAMARRASRATAPLRRLSKRELNHTLQDLFEIDSDFVGRLPADPNSEHGYDTDSERLLVSMTDLRLYHDIAREAADSYVTFGEQTDQKENFFVELEDVYHYGRLEGDDLSYERSATPLSIAQIDKIKAARKGKAPVYRDRIYGPLPHGFIPTGQAEGVGEGRGFARLHEQFMLLKTSHEQGEVTVRVNAAMLPGREGDNSVPRLRLEAGWRKIQSLRVKNIGEHDITASKDNPQTVEFTFRLEDVIAPDSARLDETGKDKWVLLVLSNVARHDHGALAGSIYGQVDMNLESYKTVDIPYVEQAEAAVEYTKKGMKKWSDGGVPYLVLDAVEASITPIESDPSIKWRIPLPKEGENGDSDEISIAKAALTDFASVAYRRAISETELEKLMTLFSSLRSDGDDFKTAMRETIASTLISPNFLYIGYPLPEELASNNTDADDQASYEVLNNNHYLASRLSYFLWSSMPDETLKDLAAQGKLSDPYVLSNQVERMLGDTRSRRLSGTFAKQWLQLKKLDNTIVSYEHYPDYGVEFSKLTAQQSIATFQDNFHQRRDARTLYSSDHMMLNDQLARHYGVPDVAGGELRRVAVDDANDRAGLLTQASVLTINSDGKESHPIKRGVWMLERILNDPPPPPPPSAPELDGNNPLLADLTLKQKIEHHRNLSACSGCHEKIDPWGILFEGFDATGRTRTHVTVGKDNKSVPVDSTSQLPDGKKINSLGELSSYLLKERESQLTSALVDHLMMYALGRELDILDKQEAKTIQSVFRSSGFRLIDLTKAIVQSDSFTNRSSVETDTKKETL